MKVSIASEITYKQSNDTVSAIFSEVELLSFSELFLKEKIQQTGATETPPHERWNWLIQIQEEHYL